MITMDGIKKHQYPNWVMYFLNVLPGTHKVTVEYKFKFWLLLSNLLFGRFKKAVTLIIGINYHCFENETTIHRRYL
jgi:hypothetical protein